MSSDYDVFISYRRDGGAETALYLRHVLHERGYRVFFDMEALRSGPFDTRLYRVIEECKDVIVVLSLGCFDRCRNEGDWFRLEIAHALKCGKNIVPFSMRQFNYDEMAVLPEDIAALKQHNGVSASYEYNDATLEKLTGFLKSRPTQTRRRGRLYRTIIGSVAACLALLFAASFFANREEPTRPPMQSMDSSSVAATRAKARVASCANNLEQCGLILKIFANESHLWLPPLDPRSGHLMWLKEPIYPELLTDPLVLLCPAEEEKNLAIDEMKDFDRKAVFALENSSYWYLGYAIPDEKTGLAFVEAYRKQVASGGDFTADLNDAEGNTLYRLREGVEQFFIQDINDDPAAAAEVQSNLPVIVERPGQHEGQINVLFMDGHVETRDYPGEFPASKEFIEALATLDTLRKP